MMFAFGIIVRLFGLFGMKISPAMAKFIAVLLVIAGLVGAFWWFRADIKEQVYQEFYAQQVEEIQKNQQRQIETLQGTIAIQQEALAKAMKERQTISKSYQDAGKRAAAKGGADGDVAPVLRDMMEEIRRLQEKPNDKP